MLAVVALGLAALPAGTMPAASALGFSLIDGRSPSHEGFPVAALFAGSRIDVYADGSLHGAASGIAFDFDNGPTHWEGTGNYTITGLYDEMTSTLSAHIAYGLDEYYNSGNTPKHSSSQYEGDFTAAFTPGDSFILTTSNLTYTLREWTRYQSGGTWHEIETVYVPWSTHAWPPELHFTDSRSGTIRLIPLRGTMMISHDSGSTWNPLNKVTDVQINDMIRTEGDTRAELRFPDGSSFRVKSNSLVTLLPDGMQIFVGDVYLNLKKQGKTFQVITPTTVCGVLGTQFSVQVTDDGTTTVSLFQGQVEAEAKTGGAKSTLSPGHRLTVTAAGMSANQSFAAFTDIAGNPYATAILGMGGAGIIDGYQVGDTRQFKPLDPVKRAQFAKMICGVMELPVSEELVAPFGDLGDDDPADPYPHEYVAAAAAAGITQGVRPGEFVPWDPIKRAQVVTMIVRAATQIWPGALNTPPADYAGQMAGFTDQTHGSSMRTAEYNGLFDGLAGFGPAWDPYNRATRGEVALMLWNLMMR